MPKSKKDKCLKNKGHLRSFTARFFALLVFMLNFQQISAMEHFGAAPKGYIKYGLKTFPKKAIYQIVGSLNPASLLVNGQVIIIKDLDNHKINGIWINDKKYPTSGKNKTFYIEHIQKEQLQNLKIRLGQGKSNFTHTIKLSSLYLDYPYEEVIYSKENLTDIPFQFLNNIDSELKVNHDSNFKTGKGIITGYWREKIINLPYRVTKETFNPKNIIFALDTSNITKLKKKGSLISGMVTPGSHVFFNDKEVSVSKDGKFQFHHIPTNRFTKGRFKILLGDKKLSKSFHFVCPDFYKAPKWYNPPLPKKYFELAIMDEDWSRSPSLTGEQFRSQSHQKVRFSYPIKDPTEFLGFEVLEAYNRYDSKTSLQINQSMNFYYRYTYHKDFGWFYGGDLILENIKFKKAGANCNFCEDFEQQNLHARIFGGHRFRVFSGIEWSPQFSLRKSMTNALFSEMFVFEMLSFRYNY